MSTNRWGRKVAAHADEKKQGPDASGRSTALLFRFHLFSAQPLAGGQNRAGEVGAGEQVSTYGWGRRVLIQGVLDVFLRTVVGLLKAAHR